MPVAQNGHREAGKVGCPGGGFVGGLSVIFLSISLLQSGTWPIGIE